ncbi:uncharacterized protein [Drosophila takahashii]|uniref:uncharacterized protein n=1 Tax=Drosophila takahashii TaxID=29030 RepID=UPI001CF7F92F|nr:uncharacterized protein LOC108060285 [Drosophila takahashii]
MQQSIWSSPQVGGSGGALKALARNVANHLKLNRSSMKRVVAQVVAEHHTLGEVADYKGHMYFAKPDRLNFHQLIAQSKEAFDDLLLHEPRSAKKRAAMAIRNRSKNPLSSKVNLQMKVSPPQLPASGVAKKASAAKKTEAKPKNRRRRKSSTTIFQLADAGRRSLNGVIIDDTHLPHDGEQREILLHVPSTLTKRSRRRLRSSQSRVAAEKKAERAQSPKKVKAKKSQEPGNLDKKISQQGKNSLREKNSLPEKNCLPEKNHLPEKKCQKPKPKKPSGSPPSVTRPGSPLPSQRSPRRNNARTRQASHQRIKAGDTRNSATKPLTKTSSVQKTKTRLKLRPLKKRLPLLRRSYEKPWLVRGLRRRRLSGGSQVAKLRNKKAPMKPQRLDKIDVEWEKKSGKEEKSEPSARSSKVAEAIKSSAKLKGKRTSHVGRQMRNVNFPWYTPYQFQGAAGATQIPNAGVGIPPYQLLREKSRKLNQRLTATQTLTQIPQSRRAPIFTSRQRHHRRMQERLMRDLLREEAIDEPLSNGSGVFRRSRGGGGGWQPQRIKSEPETQQKQQQQQDHRSVERVSSRMKRLANDRRCRQPIATSERIMIPPPKNIINKNNNNRAHSSPRIRRRFRSVPVDSSLGSIALMGQPEQSKPGLTPAKRHLTIAFMNKRSERNSAAIQPWK